MGYYTLPMQIVMGQEEMCMCSTDRALSWHPRVWYDISVDTLPKGNALLSFVLEMVAYILCRFPPLIGKVWCDNLFNSLPVSFYSDLIFFKSKEPYFRKQEWQRFWLNYWVLFGKIYLCWQILSVIINELKVTCELIDDTFVLSFTFHDMNIYFYTCNTLCKFVYNSLQFYK